LINVEAVWWKVEVFTGYQVIACEMQVRGRFMQSLNDPEPYATLHNVATTPLLPGAPRLQSIAEGILNKPSIGAIRTVDPEPPAPDDGMMEMTKRFLYFEGAGFTVKGAAEFPLAADPKLHREMLFKSKFFPLFDASLAVVGAEMAAPLQWPKCYVNRDLLVALYMG
jgi:hypothetical protein